MLCVNNYSQEYIDFCRSRIELQFSTYKNLVTTARNIAGSNESLLDCAIESFEPNFFNSMVLVLDNYFSNRSRTLEKKDGNPLNEVRMIFNSILKYNNIMTADKTIRYNPVKSVLKLKIGDDIRLNQTTFTSLYKAFFAEIEDKFLAGSLQPLSGKTPSEFRKSISDR